MEQIAAETNGPKWMQVFLYKDRGLTAEFIARAKAAGYQGLVLTVDNQVMAVRDRDARNGLMFPMKLRARGLLDLARHPGWLMRMRKAPNPTFVNYGARISVGAFGPVMAEQLDPDIGFASCLVCGDCLGIFSGRALGRATLDLGRGHPCGCYSAFTLADGRCMACWLFRANRRGSDE